MKKLKNHTHLPFMILMFFVAYLNTNGQTTNNRTQSENSSCGAKVLEYLVNNYYDAPEFSSLIPQKNKLSIAEMLQLCRNVSPDANAIFCETEDLINLPKPIILHLNFGHYILLNDTESGTFQIYDPSAPHLINVSQHYLKQNCSGNVILLVSNELSTIYNSSENIDNINGAWDEFFFPPNINEPGYYRGNSECNIPQNKCTYNYGQPVISINPLILNLVAVDIPLWYDAGKGPDIELQLTYNSNDKNEITGGLPSPVQYFPMGFGWSFSYAAFYKEETNGAIKLIMSDGQRMDFTVVSDNLQASLKTFYHKFEKYPVNGGNGYCLTMKNTRMKYHFDNPVHKKLTSIEDRNGNAVIMHYNENNNLIAIEDANERMTNFELNNEGRITKATDPFDRETLFEYGYTGNKFLTKITDMGGFTSNIEYGEVHVPLIESRIISITTPSGESRISYSVPGTIWSGDIAFTCILTNPCGVSSKVEYYLSNNTHGTTRVYDNNEGYYDYIIDNTLITHIITPDPDATEFYTYDNNGNKTNISKGTWETIFTYDTRGNTTNVVDPIGNTTSMAYDTNDNLIMITDPMNRNTILGYDVHDNLIEINTPVSTSSFSYNSNGSLKDFTDPRSLVTLYNYDNLGYLSEIIFPQGNPTTFTNDIVGRPTSIISNGVEINYIYDDLNQITQISYTDGTTIKYQYDFQNLAHVIDRGGRKMEYAYDGMSQVIQSTGPQGEVNYIRDGNGNILSVSINGVTTSNIYDEMNQVLQMTNPDGTTRYFTYDELGNLLTRLDENGTMTTYTYDFDLLTQIDYSDDTPDVEFIYNDNGEVTSMTDVTGLTAYTYDEGGRLIYINRPGNGGDMSYTYDPAGNRLNMSIPDMNVGYEYDNLNRLTKVESEFASAEYQFDENSNLIKKSYGNESFTNYTYDGLNRLLSMQNEKSTGEIFSGFEYTYEDASMIKTILDYDGSLYSYKYDEAYQLTEEKVEDAGGHILWHDKFTYDNMGNRLTQNKNGITDYYVNNINNQLVSLKKQSNNVKGVIFGDTAVKVYVNNILANITITGDTLAEFMARDVTLHFSSDTGYFVAYANRMLAEVDDSASFVIHTKKYPNRDIYLLITDDTIGISRENINPIRRNYQTIQYNYDPNGNLVERITPFDTTNYTFDAENRLTKVELAGNNFEEYDYDGLWQRTKVNFNGILTKDFVYNNLFEAVKSITDDTSQLLLRGPSLGGGIGGLISSNDEKYGTVYNFFNLRGDNISSISESNLMLSTRSFTAFGNIIIENGENVHNLSFSTKEYNEYSGLAYYGYRYYSPSRGRWIVRDPIGYNGGINLYGFVNNNPTNYIDYFGLYPNEWFYQLKSEAIESLQGFGGLSFLNNTIPILNLGTMPSFWYIDETGIVQVKTVFRKQYDQILNDMCKHENWKPGYFWIGSSGNAGWIPYDDDSGYFESSVRKYRRPAYSPKKPDYNSEFRNPRPNFF